MSASCDVRAVEELGRDLSRLIGDGTLPPEAEKALRSLIERAGRLASDNATMAATIAAQEARIVELATQLAALTAQIARLQRDLYGSRSERNKEGGDGSDGKEGSKAKDARPGGKPGRKKERGDSVNGTGLRFNENAPVIDITVTPPEIEGLAEDDYEVISERVHCRVAALDWRHVVTLPLPQGEAAIQPPVEAAAYEAIGTGRALDVLIVEDNVVNAMVVEAFVGRMGHTPLVAPTAEEGLELLEEQAFDLVLMDISLPGIDGIEATQRIRAHADATIRSLPVIAMSAHVFDNEVAQHLQSGMDAFIGKPIAPDGLAQTITSVLGRTPGARAALDGGRADDRGESIIDPAVLAQDRAVLGAERGGLMVDTFIETAPAQIEGIRQALAEGRAERAADLAHALRGAAGSLGLRRLADRCGVLEARARTPEAAAVAEGLDRLFDESREALVTLWAGLETAEREDQVVTAGVNR